MQYLIRTIQHNGQPFTDVTKIRENETYQVVEAESKEEAKRKASDKIQCPRCESWNTNHEYYYVENEPVYIAFKCFDCDAVFGEYIEKDKPKGLLSYVKPPWGTFEEQLQKIQDNALSNIRKDSE